MDTGELLHLSLVLHIIGLTIVGGSNLIAFVMQAQFWKLYEQDKGKGAAVMIATSKVPRITMVGLLLLILSGVAMMVITQGAFGGQVWFKIKMSVLLIIIINALLFGRKSGATLRNLIIDDTNGKDMTPELRATKRRIRVFYLIQLSLLLIIFVLSVFKFNNNG
jgi:uncharacterized membrane protein